MMNENDFLRQIKQINQKIDIDTEFPDWKKKVQFIAKSNERDLPFYFETDGKKVVTVASGKLIEADVTIEGNQEDLSRLFEGNLSLLEGYIIGNLNITGPFGDATGAHVLIQGARIF